MTGHSLCFPIAVNEITKNRQRPLGSETLFQFDRQRCSGRRWPPLVLESPIHDLECQPSRSSRLLQRTLAVNGPLSSKRQNASLRVHSHSTQCFRIQQSAHGQVRHRNNSASSCSLAAPRCSKLNSFWIGTDIF